jgi:hypothetical protein
VLVVLRNRRGFATYFTDIDVLLLLDKVAFVLLVVVVGVVEVVEVVVLVVAAPSSLRSRRLLLSPLWQKQHQTFLSPSRFRCTQCCVLSTNPEIDEDFLKGHREFLSGNRLNPPREIRHPI